MSKKKKTTEERVTESLVPKEEQFYKLPENWSWVRMGKIVSINPQKPKIELPNEFLCSFLPMNKVNPETGSIEELEERKFEKVKKGYTYFEENDVLFAKITPCMENGNTVIAKGLKDLIGYGSTEFYVFRTPKQVDERYIYYLLRSENFRKQAKAVMSGAVGQQRVPKKFLESYPLALPPLNEQKRIAIKVERLLNKIDEAKQLIEEVKKTFELRRAAILDKAFRGELSSWWRKENHAAQTSGELIDTVKQEYYNSLGKKLSVEKNIKPEKTPFDIPKEWTWAKAIDVCDVRDGTHDSPKYQDKGFPLVTSKNLKNGELVFDNIKFISEEDHMNIKKRSKVDTGDILFAMIGTIGNPVLIKEIKEEFSIKNVALFKPLKSINEEFLAYYLESLNFLDPLKRNAKGSTQKFVSLGKLRDSLFPVPPLEEQFIIVKALNKLFSIEREIIENIENINPEETKQSILSKAFRGELGTNDPSEESAIELLKEVVQEQVK